MQSWGAFGWLWQRLHGHNHLWWAAGCRCCFRCGNDYWTIIYVGNGWNTAGYIAPCMPPVSTWCDLESTFGCWIWSSNDRWGICYMCNGRIVAGIRSIHPWGVSSFGPASQVLVHVVDCWLEASTCVLGRLEYHGAVGSAAVDNLLLMQVSTLFLLVGFNSPNLVTSLSAKR